MQRPLSSRESEVYKTIISHLDLCGGAYASQKPSRTGVRSVGDGISNKKLLYPFISYRIKEKRRLQALVWKIALSGEHHDRKGDMDEFAKSILLRSSA